MAEQPAPFDREREGFRPDWGKAFRLRRARKRRLRNLAVFAPVVLLFAFQLGEILGPQPLAALLGGYSAALVWTYASLRSFPCPRCGMEFCAQDADAILKDREDLECARCGLPNPASSPRDGGEQ